MAVLDSQDIVVKRTVIGQTLKENSSCKFFFIKILEKMQQIFDCDHRPARL